MTILSAETLRLWRGDAPVLRGLSFTLAAGRCLEITGANGAGKTTLLRALCGLLPLEEGRVFWRGANTADDALAFHAELAYLGHDNALKADLNAHENLHYAVGLRRAVQPADIAAALARVGIGVEAARVAVRRLSAGQRRRVALARVVLLNSALWVLDEPTANLDATGQQLAAELLETHLRAGGAAVVATHRPIGLAPAWLQSLTLQ
jgi:heme exporter protein A